jgi:DNA-binding NarL/FixJ family response regulator
MQSIRIVIADDHPMVLDGLSSYFINCSDIEVIATTCNANDIEKIVGKHNPDILLVDYHFSNQKITGLDICKQVVKFFLNTKVIVISSFSEIALIKQFIDAGACGYLLKTSTQQEYIDAILNVFSSGTSFSKEVREMLVRDKLQNKNTPIKFTKTEKEILKLIIKGASTNEIASKLFRETSTIDSHRKSILSKFHLMDTDNPNPSKNIMYYVAKYNLVDRVDCL